MGTRSHTVIKQGKEIYAVMYRQFDGYLTGHGTELAEFLEGFQFVNGFNSDLETADLKVANGPGCFAAQMVTYFKGKVANKRNYDWETKDIVEYIGNTVGGIYLSLASQHDERHDYTYEIVFSSEEKEPVLNVWQYTTQIATGLSIADFKVFCATYTEDDEE